MENFIIIAILVIIVGLAAGYVIKAKKSGKKCIGCPDCQACSKKGDSPCCCNKK
ncbi:MAG: FeoB-associated Cys-rich membrane protein [Clostridia bacterium]|nr:FeoB-associated Cys-rich membrane protein [Clostridia bacterium]